MEETPVAHVRPLVGYDEHKDLLLKGSARQ